MGKERASFDLSEHKKRKYGNSELNYITGTEYRKKYKKIIKTIDGVIRYWENKSGGEEKNPFVGVVLFGSWLRGIDVHSKSDIDIWLVRRGREYGDGDESDFIDDLKKRGLSDVSWGMLSFSILDDFDNLSCDVHDSVLEDGFKLITPYKWVEKEFERAKGPEGKAIADAYQKKLEENYSEW